MKTAIHTELAPAAIGTYSQAIKSGDFVFLSGQIPLLPNGELLVSADIKDSIRQIFKNLQAVSQAAGGDLDNIVKLTVYLLDFADFASLNDVMKEFFTEPFPARAAVQVVALPKDVAVEVDAIMTLV
ncbi:MAG: RidA family protein [Pseudomonadota bacterium]|nr:RidA family protein [Pseudomonadota bacterium]